MTKKYNLTQEMVDAGRSHPEGKIHELEGCTLWIKEVEFALSTEVRYIMLGRTGSHSLLVSATSLERLQAHWHNFVFNNRVR